MKISKACQLDFRAESGKCLALEGDRLVDEECQLLAEDCSERFFMTKKSGRSRFVLVNLLRPCYSQWLVDKYTDEESDWYEHGDYRVVEFNLGAPVDSPKYYEESVVQLLLQSHWDFLESPSGEMCYYRIETSVKNMIGGSYSLKLWDEDRELMLETTFND